MRFYKFLLVLALGSISTTIKAQDTLSKYKAIPKPSILSNHVFGIFLSRLEANFKSQLNENIELQIDYQSANVWGQPVENFIPNTTILRNQVSGIPWHKREFVVDRNDENFINSTDDFSIAYDGVIKGLKANLKIPINEQNGLEFELRSFILTDGKLPLSPITGDDFIEWIHSNIAGGEDPFQRRDFGLNQSGIDYKDRDGRVMEINKNDAFFGGLKINYYHYLKNFSPFGFHLNFGAHTGLNLSPYNKSVDFGISTNAIKTVEINHSNYIQFGLSLGYLDLNTAELSNENIEFGTRSFFLNFESALSYNIVNRKNYTHSFGLDFYIQTSYNDPSEFDYSILFRNDLADRSWHHSASHLYKNNNYWTLFYALTRKNSFRIYLQQDSRVNNNPDLQMGLGYLVAF